MKPLAHARISVKKFGGDVSDYIDIHNWFDSTKAHVADGRHRLVLHNSFGIFLCEQIFGEIIQTANGLKRMPYITTSDGKQVSVRDIAEQHVIDDMGSIPSLDKCLENVPTQNWVSGGKTLRTITLKRSDVTIVD